MSLHDGAKNNNTCFLWVILFVMVLSGPVPLQAADLTVDGGASYTLNAPTAISYDEERIGYSGTGTFNQRGGSNDSDFALTLGHNVGSNGIYNMSGGNLYTFIRYIGYSGIGTFNQSGGVSSARIDTVINNGNRLNGVYNLVGDKLSRSERSIIIIIVRPTVSLLHVGFNSGSLGIYNLSGGDNWNSSQFIGYSGVGMFNQDGGNNATGSLFLGYLAGGNGAYNLNDGHLRSYSQDIGYSGTGIMTQNGGVNSGANLLYVGHTSAGSGIYILNGGQLLVSDFQRPGWESIGDFGTGIFTQNGGSNISPRLEMGAELSGKGTYYLNGGILSVQDEIIGPLGTGTFTQSGGTNEAGAIEIGSVGGGTGTYNLLGGSLSADAITLTNGIFNQTGGSLVFNTFNQLGGEVRGALENRGTYTYANGLFSGRLLNYGAVAFNGDFTAGNGLANLSSMPLFIDSGRTVTLNGQGLDNQGILVLNGTLTGNGTLLNNTTGAFYGNGTVTGNFVNSGSVRPGNSVGTLNVSGTYTQTATGSLDVGIASATSYDRLNITGTPGTASLSGTLRPVPVGGFLPSPGQLFNFITATGGITGSFTTIDNGYLTPTLNWQSRYTANSLDLFVQRDYTNPTLGLDSNRYAVGAALNGVSGITTGDWGTVLTAIDCLPSNVAVGDALNQISGDKVSALSTLAFAGSDLQKRVLSRRITDLRIDGSESASAGLLPGYLDIGGSGATRLEGADSLPGLPAFLRGEPGRVRSGLFFEPAVIVGSRDTTGDQTGFDFTIAGFTAGADYGIRENLLAGLAVGYSHTDADFYGSGGSVAAHTVPITLYGAYFPKPYYAYGSLGYSLNLFDLTRKISFGGLNRKAESSPEGHLLNAYGEAGYDFTVRGAVLTPMASLSYSRLWINGFTESGAGALNLDVSSQNAESFQTGIGGRLAVPFKWDSFTLVPQVYATWQHEFSDNSRGLDARFGQPGSLFTFRTERLGRDFGVIGADITLLTHKNLKFRLDYNAEAGRSDYTAHYVSGGLRWEF